MCPKRDEDMEFMRRSLERPCEPFFWPKDPDDQPAYGYEEEDRIEYDPPQRRK